MDAPGRQAGKGLSIVFVVAVLVVMGIVSFSPQKGTPPVPSPSRTSTSTPAPTPAPTKTLVEHSIPPVCETVILMNETLVIVGNDVYTEAIKALIDDDVSAIEEATTSLSDYHDLMTEVNKTYEQDREKCLGTKSSTEKAQEMAGELLDSEEE